MKRLQSRAGRHGFTLIELLVVIVIIGIMASVIGFNMMADDPAREVRREAQRFIYTVSLAVDEATFTQREFGLYSENDGYAFGRWEVDELPADADPAQARPARWQPVVDRALRGYELPAQIRTLVEVEDSELLDMVGANAESKYTSTRLNLDNIGPNIEEDPGLPAPPIFILSSGEMTPFRLSFYYTGDSRITVTVVGDELGRVKIQEYDEL